MRQLPGAVCLVGAAHEGARRGLTLTAICSVSIDPPSLLVCVDRNASAHDLIALSGCFAVNQLSTEHMAEARVFSGQCGIDGDLRFAAERWGVLKTGAPVLNDAVAVFDCRVIDSVASQDAHGLCRERRGRAPRSVTRTAHLRPCLLVDPELFYNLAANSLVFSLILVFVFKH